jgi:hypothetical protein
MVDPFGLDVGNSNREKNDVTQEDWIAINTAIGNLLVSDITQLAKYAASITTMTPSMFSSIETSYAYLSYGYPVQTAAKTVVLMMTIGELEESISILSEAYEATRPSKMVTTPGNTNQNATAGTAKTTDNALVKVDENPDKNR